MEIPKKLLPHLREEDAEWLKLCENLQQAIDEACLVRLLPICKSVIPVTYWNVTHYEALAGKLLQEMQYISVKYLQAPPEVYEAYVQAQNHACLTAFHIHKAIRKEIYIAAQAWLALPEIEGEVPG